MARVRLEGVSKRFGSTVAVRDVTLDVPEGCFFTLLGPSGCGKTTTLRIVAGFHLPDQGEVYIDEQRVTHLPPHRRRTAMVFQEYALFPHMTVFENVAYGLRMRRVPEDQVRARVAAALELVGLPGLGRAFPSQLSGGQQQRVALARALVVEPDVLLLDEPLSNLDAKLRVRVRGEIRQLQRQLGKTVLYVTHDQEEALAISDRIAVMEAGRVLQVGTPVEIYHRPAHRFVADFVGLANFLDGEVIGPDAVRCAGVVVRLRGDGLSPGRVTVMLRPEALRLHRQPPPSGTVLPGRITASSFLGTLARYWVAAGGITWIVDVPAPGETVYEGEVFLEIPPERVHVLRDDTASA
ncbi:MAG: ABC transporter ATP-binding protein [Armatimonadota bacterium]|nr:ABC transporter ATP-binding protein [Armatimonadota bacterium]MDR7402323.1 ABC transporter ATP-binding protein [Armatimonadota bacterium]MDR7404370.1 ABC transporter ATP-binding protein [Armatimonadota bacterium]MDR7437308.1 ABC transporter ATP-binding protein [Armatimonadota bacterium]MDR7472647.1 ABC transporter ATP-binding protein [Armatimonadota bacterium]